MSNMIKKIYDDDYYNEINQNYYKNNNNYKY